MQKTIRRFLMPLAPKIEYQTFSQFSLNSSFSRMNFSTNNKDNIIEEEYEDIESTSVIKSKGNHPFFTTKNGTVTFVVDYPMFPMSKQIITLNDTKFRIFAKGQPKYVATVVRKNFDLPTEEVEQEEDPFSGKDVLSDYYTMGAYCSVEFNSRAFNTITLNSMYRVDIDDLYRYKIPGFDPTINTIDNHERMKQSHPQIFEEEEELDENNDQQLSQRDKRLKFLLEKTQKTIQQDDHPLILEAESSFLLSKLRAVDEPEFFLDLNTEVKLKHLIDLYSKILTLNRTQLPQVNYNLKDAYRILDSLAGYLASSKYFQAAELQEVFEQIDLDSRIDKIHALLRKYYSFLENFADLGQIAQQNINQRKQKEFYDEVFRIVKGAVEGDKGKQSVVDKLRADIVSKNPPKHVMKVFDEEAKRYLSLDDTSTESNMIRTYLEWIGSLPYDNQTSEDFDMDKAKAILDEDHYGLEDVKDRILEFIAVGKMKGTLKGKILCLVGPPGVGKTSLASSIARSLGRKYSRIALGGESDSSTLKGHRKTYVGAYPGKIIQALKECGTNNCVILLDEVDKLGRSGFHGDPQSNLLEILDPAQNNTFTDNYLDFPVDLSNVLFICTANITDTISGPLLDRVDLIQLSSYTNTEKKQIFDRHLYPKALENSGLSAEHKFKINEDVIDVLVDEYCREPGVRSLEKHTRKILEKVALQVVEQDQENTQEILVAKDNLNKYVGNPRFSKSRFYQETPPGVLVGLAYTEYGGSLIYIEATQSTFPSKDTKAGGLKTTGSLGSVMKESMQIAYTFAKSYLHNKSLNYLEKNEVHIHCPEGATPKDGPSAGITITSALLSLALGKPVKQNVAMTGEISLRGKVLPIGGVKEKILAAKREGIYELIFPQANQDNVEDLPDYIKEGLTLHFCENYDEVYKILFDY